MRYDTHPFFAMASSGDLIEFEMETWIVLAVMEATANASAKFHGETYN